MIHKNVNNHVVIFTFELTIEELGQFLTFHKLGSKKAKAFKVIHI